MSSFDNPLPPTRAELQAVDHAANPIFDVLLAKIDDQSQFEAGQAKIGQHLCLEDGIPLADSLVVHQNQSVHFQIQPQRIAEALAFVKDGDLQLSLNPNPATSMALSTMILLITFSFIASSYFF
jgi:hypothetical protein